MGLGWGSRRVEWMGRGGVACRIASSPWLFNTTLMMTDAHESKGLKIALGPGVSCFYFSIQTRCSRDIIDHAHSYSIALTPPATSVGSSIHLVSKHAAAALDCFRNRQAFRVFGSLFFCVWYVNIGNRRRRCLVYTWLETGKVRWKGEFPFG